MNPIEFIRKNVVTQLVGEGFPEDVARGGQRRRSICIAVCLRQAGRGASTTIALLKPGNTADSTHQNT
ncbi:hypothetical protein BSQ99_04460 [Serratia liquefaciens]|nr:hypothetical protein BSQ99_04460 [Serratia liquefaciens]